MDQIAKIYLSDQSDGNKFQNALSNLMTDWTFGMHALELLEQHQRKVLRIFLMNLVHRSMED